MILLCYGDAIQRLNGSIRTFSDILSENENDITCPSNSTAPLCCQDAFKCRGFNSLNADDNDDDMFAPHYESLSLTCGYDADLNFYMLGADPIYDNESYTACCSDPTLMGPYDKQDILESGNSGGAPGGVTEGPLLGINRCCASYEVPNDDDRFAPCETSDRCRVSYLPKINNIKIPCSHSLCKS